MTRYVTEKQKEDHRASSLKWARANAEKARDIYKKWREANPDKARNNERKWARKNRDKRRIAAQIYRDYNPEKASAATKKWREANPDKAREHHRKRRAIKKGMTNHFLEYEWRLLCEQYENHCIYPGCNRTDLTPDHVVPLGGGWGGSDTIDNIQPLCKHHNFSKGAKYIDYRNREPVKVEQLSFIGMTT